MKKLLLSLFSTTLLFAFSVLPAYAADNFFQQLTHSVGENLSRFYLMLPGDKPANQVLNLSQEAEQNVKSVDAQGNINVDLLNSDSSVANVQLNFSGPLQADNVSDFNSYKEDFTLSSQVSMQGTTLKTSGEVRNVDHKWYLKLDEVPFFPFIDLTSLKSKWLSLSQTAQQDSATSDNATATTTLTPEQQQKVHDAYIQLLSQMRADTAHKDNKDGHDVFVVEATIPKEALQAYINTLKEVTAKTDASQATPMVNAAADDKNVSTVLDQMGDLKVTLWIDRGSYYVRHIEIPVSFTPTQNEVSGVSNLNGMTAPVSQVNKVNISFVINFDKFNEGGTIEAPSDAQDIKTILPSILQTTHPDAADDNGAGPSELPQLNSKQLQQLQKLKMLTKDKQLQLDQNASQEGVPSSSTPLSTTPPVPTGY